MRRNRMCTFTSACVCIMTLMTHVGCSFTNNLPHSSDRLYLALSCLLPVFRRGNSLFFSASMRRMSHHVDLRPNVLRDQGWKLLQEFLVCKHIVNDWKLKRNVFNCSLTCFAVFFCKYSSICNTKSKRPECRYHTHSRFQSSNSRSMIVSFGSRLIRQRWPWETIIFLKQVVLSWSSCWLSQVASVPGYVLLHTSVPIVYLHTSSHLAWVCRCVHMFIYLSISLATLLVSDLVASAGCWHLTSNMVPKLGTLSSC